MSLILTQPITGPSAWKAADVANRSADWLRPLSAEAIAALDAALALLEDPTTVIPGPRGFVRKRNFSLFYDDV